MTQRPSLDDVLSAFSVEPDNGRETLERYMRQYPEYVLQLVDLSQELSRTLPDDEELSSSDVEAIEAAWAAFSNTAAAPDVFATLTPIEMSRVAKALALPRQVITAIKERRITPSTFPRRFLRRLAEELGRSFEEICATLSLPKAVAARSFKSNDKPTSSSDTVAFETILRQAGVKDDQLSDLLADDD
jgi:hypothetical protein